MNRVTFNEQELHKTVYTMTMDQTIFFQETNLAIQT